MRSGRARRWSVGVLLAAAAGQALAVAQGDSPRRAADESPRNLALLARAAASSEFGPDYGAAHAIDGKVTDPLARTDAGAAWAVRGDTHRSGADLILTWPLPVPVAELVYYGRTASQWNENWKDYAVYADGEAAPVAQGQLKAGRGPQRIRLARPVTASRLTIRFLSSYGGLNPGAVEVQVYGSSPPEAALGVFRASPPAGFESPASRPSRPPRAPAPAPAVADEAVRRALIAGPLEGATAIIFAARHGGRDGHWYANFAYYARSTDRKAYGAGGGGLYRLDLQTGQAAALVDPGDGAVRDPAVHYDGRRIVFAWRKEGTDHYNLYEVRADGTALRQITDGPWDDIEPCWLPDGDLVFCSSRCKRWVNCWLTQVAVLYRCRPDGSGLRPLSANAEHDNTPWVLPDGRLLHMRWEYVDRSQVDYHHLWTMNPDGTGQMVYFGNLHPGTVMIDAKPVPGTDRVLATFSGGHGAREHQGPFVVVDPNGGPDERASVARVPGGSGRDPYPLAGGAVLFAGGRSVVLLDAGRPHVLYTDPSLEVHEPRPLRPRPREPVIAPSADPARPTGRLVLADVRIGRNMDGVAPGDVRRLLVLEALPKPVNYTGGMDPLSYGGTFTLERVVGTVPVEADGSAYLELPALRSFFFVALDSSGDSVKRMQSFLAVQPGETMGCVGCHEPRTRTVTPPAGLLALRRPPSRPEPVPGVPDVLDFPRDVQPVLDRRCLACHDYDRRPGSPHGPRAGGVILSGDRGPMFSHSYYTLTLRRQVADGRNEARGNRPPRSIGTAASPLMKKLGGAHHDVRLSEREINIIRCWIESGAAYPGTYAALGTGMIGGYDENRPVETDGAWPETKAAGEAIARRCATCHKGPLQLPRALADENGLSFWRPNWGDARLGRSRHIVFNLTRPEKSLMLLAPLAKEAGGYGRCAGRDPDGPAEPVFRDTTDPDYEKIRAMIAAGGRRLEEIKRFDMPGFRPDPAYVREMKRYGVLGPEAGAAALDVYATDQAYWRSLWWPPAPPR